MTRLLYQWLLWLHPPFFRRQFAGEMLWIFDSSVDTEGAAGLLGDGMASLARQWLLRSGSWKIAVALAGGLLQVTLGGFGMMIFGQQQMRSYASTAPYTGDWVGTLESGGNATPIELVLGRNGDTWLGSFLTTDPGGAQRTDVLGFQVRQSAVQFRVTAASGEMQFYGRLAGGKLGGTFRSIDRRGAWRVERNSARAAGLKIGLDDLVGITVCVVPGVIVSVILLALWTLGFTRKRIQRVG